MSRIMVWDSVTGQRRAAHGFGRRTWSRYGRELHRYLMNRLRNAQDARDLAQEVYLRLLRIGKDERVHDFRAYMYRIASHVVYEYRYRARETHVHFDSEAVRDWGEQPVEEISDEPYERLCTEKQLEELYRQLTPHCQVVFLLYMRDRLSCEQIAKQLNLSVHTVKKYLTRAIGTLRDAKWDFC